MSAFIPPRGTNHVAPGDVASKYSPAAYLTELWTKAKTLHPNDHPNALNIRRPDIGERDLTQENMDKEVSTLELSNQILMRALSADLDYANQSSVSVLSDPYDISSSDKSHYYSHFLHALRGILSTLPDDESGIFNDQVVANSVFSGISFNDPRAADDVAQQAQVWRLTQFHGVAEEDARVMCGEEINQIAKVNEITGDLTPSQFDRLFGRQGGALLTSTDVTEQRRIMMSAFGVNDGGLTLLASLAGWTSVGKVTLVQVSGLYAWVLLSRALGYSLAELNLLNTVTSPAKAWLRYTAFRSALDWLAEQNLSVAGLGALTAPEQAMSGPVLDTLIDTLKRECITQEGLTRHKLTEAVSATLGLSSGSQADALLGWLDSSASVGGMSSTGLIYWTGSAKLNREDNKVRYVMLRRAIANDYFAVKLLEVLSGDVNLATAANGATVTIGTQGAYAGNPAADMLLSTGNGYASLSMNDPNAWVQIDLGAAHEIDSIRLTPRSNQTGYMTDCYVYVSDTDMSAWASKSLPGDTDCLYPLVGKTLSEAKATAQSVNLYTEADVSLYLGHLLRYALVANALGLTENVVATLANHHDVLSTEGNQAFSLPRLTALSQLQSLTHRCGAHAPALLEQLAGKTLTVSALANFTNQDTSVLTSALPVGTQAGASLNFAAATQTLDTMALCQRTGLSLTSITQLRSLSTSSSFDDWNAIATFLMNELAASVRMSVQQHLAEELSLALVNSLLTQDVPAEKTRYLVFYVPSNQPAPEYFSARSLYFNGASGGLISNATIFSSVEWDPAFPANSMLDANTDAIAKTATKLGPLGWVVVDLGEATLLKTISLEEEYIAASSWLTMFALPDGALPPTITTGTMPSYATVAAKALASVSWQRNNDRLNSHSLSTPTVKRFINREAMSDYLLIDPQLSGQTLTSPLAWSIAAVQLYIDRCLSGDEPGVISAAKDVQFFEVWDRYNKRYSQWAGLQQLLWEPENFIAPSLRLSQTEAFGHLLQKLDGGVLNEETAEEAFTSYLTEFEQMAEIIPISGWHDSEDLQVGRTFLLGISKNMPTTYYWRSFDHSQQQAGSPMSHAWTGWSKIDFTGNPFTQSACRPMVQLLWMNHRLYLVWMEVADIRNPADRSKTLQRYTVKTARQRYDQSWTMLGDGIDININKLTDNTVIAQVFMVCNMDEPSNTIRVWAGYEQSAPTDGTTIHTTSYLTIDSQGGEVDRFHYVPNHMMFNHLFSGDHLSETFLLGRASQGVTTIPNPDALLRMETLSIDFVASNPRLSQLVYKPATILANDIATPTLVVLGNNFPSTLMSLNIMGVEAVFALTEARKDLTTLTQLVDFGGTFSPYYWELFYHVPLVISQRLKQQQNYAGATRWQEYVFKPAGYTREEVTTTKRKVRYVMLRRSTVNSYFAVKQLKILNGTTNLATGGTVTIGDQGEYTGNPPADMLMSTDNGYASNNTNTTNAWVQIDLSTEHEIDSISLTPRSAQTSYMTNCWVYVSDTDMSAWAKTSKPGDTDNRYLRLGKTKDVAMDTLQSFSVTPLPSFSTSYWNPLPLESDTDWGTHGQDVIPNNTTDPDVIAEGDPMHYKLATFMSYLDLLMARGDTAYRQLERDTLVEAGMWYQKAQCLLGEQPVTPASSTALPAVKQATEASFQPQENEKLNGYWQQLRQRLYNLRHNLTLDGQPLNLPLYAKPANPADLLSAALASASGQTDLPGSQVGQLRFRPALEVARGLAGQLVQFGSTLQGITERQDAEAMNQMLQTQGGQLLTMTCGMQKRTLASLDADLAGLAAQRTGIETRQAYYQSLYDENISSSESAALALNVTSAALLTSGGASHLVGGGLDMVPNIFGLADGGSRWGALANGLGAMMSNTAFALSTTAGVLTQQDAYSRRRGEWILQLDGIKSELTLLDKQVESLTIRRDAADMQMTYLQTQQQQAALQLQFLKSKFTNQQLYSWMRSRLASIFWQFYDVTVSASLRAEQSYQFETGESSQRFIRPGAWQSSMGGLLCGESLLLDLAHMEEAWLAWDKRTLEVTRTVSLASVLKSTALTPPTASDFSEGIQQLLNAASAQAATYSWSRTEGNKTLSHVLKTDTDGILGCEINLAELNIPADYPASLGAVRRIKNISVSLPALVGPYQDIQAALSYSESGVHLPAGCEAIAVSHGVNDSGQFQLDFNDPRYLPFEGVSLPTPAQDNAGALSLRFPNAWGKQHELLKSLNDVILHIRYTIRH